jgi:hypothetical protein
MQHSEQLTKVIEETIQEILTCEEKYFSASKENITRKEAEEMLCEFIPMLMCEHYLTDILDQACITKLLNSAE